MQCAPSGDQARRLKKLGRLSSWNSSGGRAGAPVPATSSFSTRSSLPMLSQVSKLQLLQLAAGQHAGAGGEEAPAGFGWAGSRCMLAVHRSWLTRAWQDAPAAAVLPAL